MNDATPRWKYRFANYKRALTLLREAMDTRNEFGLNQLETEGAIQRFEMTMELVIHGAVREAAIDRLRTLFIESNLPVSVDIFSYEGITYRPLRAHVDAVRQRLFTAQDLRERSIVR